MTSARLAAGRSRDWRKRFKDPLVASVVGSLALLSLILVAFALIRGRNSAPAGHTVRFVLATPDSARPTDGTPWPGAISPDGSTIVYQGRAPNGGGLYAQQTDQLDARLLPGTRHAQQPVFSPDGGWVAFEADAKLKKMRLDGSAPINVADAGSENGIDWTTRDEFVFGAEQDFHGLSKVSASGGTLREFVKPDTTKGETDFLWPIAVPDGKSVVFVIWSGSLATSRLASASVDGGDVKRWELLGVRPLAVIDNILVYVQADGAVMGVKLDRSARNPSGSPVPVLDPVDVGQGLNGNSEIFVSRNGALLTGRGGTNTRLTWIGRDGSVSPLSQDTRQFGPPRLSPDGTRIAVAAQDAGKSAIWIYEISTGTFSRLSSADAASSPSWTSDGRSVIYAALGGTKRYALWMQNADGGTPARKLFDATPFVAEAGVARDGKAVLYIGYSRNAWHVFKVALDSPSVTRTFIDDASAVTQPAFSPDGKWVLLSSVESGQAEVFVYSYPDPVSRTQVSAGGGSAVTWSTDGSKVYYRNGPTVISATLATTPRLRIVSRDTVFRTVPVLAGSGPAQPVEVTRDGRFLGLVTNRNDYQLVIAPNWLPEMRQRLAGGR